MKSRKLEIVRAPEQASTAEPRYAVTPTGPRRVHKIQPLDLIQADIRIVGM